MGANSYPTYEDAARDYLAKLNALMQLPQGWVPGRDIDADGLISLAEEIANISSAMISRAEKYLSDSEPLIQEGISCHFIDQATAELLLETGLMQIVQEELTGIPPAAAIQATLSAALREAISAAEKSMAFPVAQGLVIGASYRITESSGAVEAASAFKLAFGCTASTISHRVQELGSDITIDLVSGSEWTAVLRGASSRSPAENLLNSAGTIDGPLATKAAFTAAKILRNVYEKVMALVNRNAETEARKKIGDWLEKIKQTEKIEIFSALVENLYGLEGLTRLIERNSESPAAAPELINRASDLIRTCSDKFIVLTGRMRKFEDALRLGKIIQLPQLLPTVIALQVELLSALVYAGHDYINKCEKCAQMWKA
jgi:hypothetical protein